MAAPAHDDEAPATSTQPQPQLDASASRLLTSAQRASDVAKRAFAVGIETTQVHMRQVSDAVLENSQRAKVSSKDFLSKVHVKTTNYAGKAQERAGHYAGKAQEKASQYKGNVSRAIQQSKDGEGEKLGFPLSIMVWCSTLCGGSKKKRGDTTAEREMAPSNAEEGEEFSSEFLASTADEYAAALDEAADKLEEAVADKEKGNALEKA